MTPEKLQLLREFVRAEIDYAIMSNSGFDGYDWSIDAGKRADKVFFQLCQEFCDVD